MKTHQGMKKRLKITGSGRLMRKSAKQSHLLTKKSAQKKRDFRHNYDIAKPDHKNIKKLIPGA